MYAERTAACLDNGRCLTTMEPPNLLEVLLMDPTKRVVGFIHFLYDRRHFFPFSSLLYVFFYI